MGREEWMSAGLWIFLVQWGAGGGWDWLMGGELEPWGFGC